MPTYFILVKNKQKSDSYCHLTVHKSLWYVANKKSFKQLFLPCCCLHNSKRCNRAEQPCALYRFLCHCHVLCETWVNQWNRNRAVQINVILYKLGLSPVGAHVPTYAKLRCNHLQILWSSKLDFSYSHMVQSLNSIRETDEGPGQMWPPNPNLTVCTTRAETQQ